MNRVFNWRHALPGLLLWLSVANMLGRTSAQDSAHPVQNPTTKQEPTPAPAPLQISREDMTKLFVKRVRPVYPPLAQQARVTGKCLVRVTVSTDGAPRNILLVYGHPMLGPAATEAARKSKYRPYLVQGQPVEVEGEVEYEIY